MFGAASMGALRAVELEAYGMHGSGWVFDAFRAGALEDDEEVAVLHGPAETGFVPVSDAMVNIRATIAAALRAGVIEGGEAETLVRMAKRTFYKERSWSTLLSDAGGVRPTVCLGPVGLAADGAAGRQARRRRAARRKIDDA